MNIKKIAPFLLLAFVPVVAYLVTQNRSAEETAVSADTPEQPNIVAAAVTTASEPEPDGKGEFIEMIRVFAPTENQVIASPVTIRGEARGGWYFEADFPVRIVDANGTVLAEVPVQAIGEWMTMNFVPFDQSVAFSQPATDTGFIIFQKDNPSGLSENAEEYRLPVRFQQ